MSYLIDDLRDVLNRHSAENGSNTPDHVLARLLTDTLEAWDRCTRMRDSWYGVELSPGAPGSPAAHEELRVIAEMPDVKAHLGVGGGSVVDAVTALVGALECARRDARRPQPAPRYDSVFEEGTAELDRLAHDDDPEWHRNVASEYYKDGEKDE